MTEVRGGNAHKSMEIIMKTLNIKILDTDYCKRIGQYNFTEQDRIKPLNYTEQSLRETSSGAILYNYMKKINELVKAVNRLEKKVNGD